MLRDEDGAILLLAAVSLAVFLLLTAVVVNVGNWFTHKRQLQNRADAAALAAGVEYATNWLACIGNDATARANAAAAITAAARKYAGDPADPGAVNTGVADQNNVQIILNSTSFTAGTDFTDGTPGDVADPCYGHDGDAISPVTPPGKVRWTDVRVREDNILGLFGLFGIDLPHVGARARVEIRPAISDNGFLPLGVPDNRLEEAQVRFYNVCTGAQIGQTVPVVRLESQFQGQANMSIFGAATGTGVNQTLTPITLPKPSLADIAQCGGNVDHVPIRTEIRVSSKPNLDITTPTCAQVAAYRYADCWSDLHRIRAWNPRTSDNEEPPAVDNVQLFSSGGNRCAPDPYFLRLGPGQADCRFGATVNVDWGTRAAGTFQVTVNGVAAAGSGSGPDYPTWSTPESIVANPPPNNYGGDNITVTLSWEQTSGTWQGNTCSNAGNNPCDFSGSYTVHRSWVGTDNNAGIVEMFGIRYSGSTTLADSFPADDPNDPNDPDSVSINVTVGLHANLKAGQFTILRQGDAQANQSLVCDPDYTQGKTYQMFRDGCKPPYSYNDTFLNDQTGFWWDGTECPASGAFFQAPSSPGNYANAPWKCIPTEPGFRPVQIGDGIAAHTGNCTNMQNNSCSQTACVNPINYPGYPGNPTAPFNAISADDERVIKVYILPFGALKTSTGNDTVPLLDFAAFYVTGWKGQNNQNVDPCPGNDNNKADTGTIVGYFINWVDPGGVGDPTASCTLDQLRPCVSSLVR